MSNDLTATLEAERELEEEKQQLIQAAETEKAKAEPEQALPPEPIVPPAPAPSTSSEPTVTPTSSEPEPAQPATVKDDPLKWAEKKGLKTPEDMARALQQKEQEFHKRNQAGHPGYRDINPEQPVPPPPPPNWQPRPEMGYPPPYDYGYPPPPPMPPQRINARDIAAFYPQLDPQDVERVLPLIMDTVKAVSSNQRSDLQREIFDIRRSAERNNELMSLMQDDAWKDNRVQEEIHRLADANPTIFQRPGAYTLLFKEALGNLARKQLQQGVTSEPTATMNNKPPVTAGGGNGSANTGPRKFTEREINSWSIEDQKAFLTSNGRVYPRK